MIKITLLGNPKSNNHIYKTHGHIVYMTKEGKFLKEGYQFQAKTQYKGEPLEGKLEISIGLYFEDKRIHDIDNFGKILLDALTGILWIDDSQIVTQKVSKFYDKKLPRIEIEVEKI